MGNIPWPSVLIFGGALLAAVGAFWSASQTAEFERELRTRSDRIAELNGDIAASVTGGSSFCYLVVASADAAKNAGVLTLVHSGDHPLYDVSVRIVDLEQFDKIKSNVTLDTLAQAQQVFRVGNIPAGQAVTIQRYALPKGDSLRLNIFMAARNGSWCQTLRLARVDGKWVQATKIDRERRDGSSEEIFSKIEASFPVDDKGEALWE